MPGFIDEIGNAFRGQNRPAPDDDKMQSDPQAWQFPGSLDGIFGHRGCDHQAGGGEDAVPMRGFDRFVYG